MKHLRNIFTTVLVVALIQTATWAADDAKISVKKVASEEKAAVIRVTNLSSDASAILKIKDAAGNVLHREVVNQSDVFAKKYDFSQLSSGEYMVELNTEEGTTTETFALENGESRPLYFKPAIEVESDMVKVAFINRVDHPVSIKLYDYNGQVLYEESVSPEEKFSKGLNVSRLDPGAYSLSILGDNYVYSEDIQLQ